MAASHIGPDVKTSPYTTCILLPVLGANCILVPGLGPIPGMSGASMEPNALAVPKAIPAVITPATILAIAVYVPVALAVNSAALTKLKIAGIAWAIIYSNCNLFLIFYNQTFHSLLEVFPYWLL